MFYGKFVLKQGKCEEKKMEKDLELGIKRICLPVQKDFNLTTNKSYN